MQSASLRPDEMSKGFESAWTDPPPAGAEEDALVGATLSRTYRITRVLGEGGMGRVYEAWHTRIKKKRYAIKVLHPEFARSPEVLSRFQREAEAAACLSHPNAVGVYDVALTPQGWPYLVCDFLEGIDFSVHLRKHAPLSAAVAKHIVLQVCDALVEAHANGVVHRDLKPQNVFLVGDFEHGVPTFPNAKVLDFGLSRFLDSSDSELTKTGMVMGTPSYMAPEQARGERVDHRCDIYGVGALFYAALTGRPPFKTETPQATILAVMNDVPPRPSSLNPDIPTAVEFVVQRAMAKEPDQRYQTMEELRTALLELDLGDASAYADNDPAGAAKTRMMAPLSAHDRAADMKNARIRFLGYSALSLTLAFASSAAAISGSIVLALGRWPLTRMETLLTLLILVGTLLTPSLLLIRWLRKHVWNNTARVVELLGSMRRAVNAGMFTYGISALTWLFIDDVLIHFVDTPRLATNSGLHWPGTALFLLLSAGCVSAVTWWQGSLERVGGWVDRAGRGRGRSLRRFVVGPVLAGMATLLAVLTLGIGTAWRYADTRDGASITAEAEPTTADQGAVELNEEQPAASAQQASSADAPAEPTSSTAQSAPAPSETAAPATTDVPLSLAPAAELRAAIASGEEALVALLKRFPDDPKVLRAVAVNQASRSSTLVDSAKTFKRLFAASPASAQETDLQNMVVQMTRSKDAGKLAYALLGESMGSIGPDLLYKISLTHRNQRDAALRELGKSSVRKNFSPQLQIAFELRFSQSCKGRVPLLPRAEQFGDDRSIRTLRSLARTPSRCAKRPCKPTCPSQAEQFLQTIDVISKRLAASGK